VNIHELLEYGPIVAHDEDLDLLVTANGAYFNLWHTDRTGEYQNIEAYDVASRLDLPADVSPFNPLELIPFWKVAEAAEQLLDGILAGEDEEE
jgi:hypothetical protein